MAIEETVTQDKIEVIGAYKQVHVRDATVITKDGLEIGRSFHRHVLSPGDDISGETDEVQAVCNAVWTQAVIDAYAAFLASQELA